MTQQPLSQRQLEVLRWIADGCPEDVWPDEGHKISARALERRNLVEVTRRGGRWSAEMKSDGTYYLKHGGYPPTPDAVIPKPKAAVAPRIGFGPRVSAEELVAQLQSLPDKTLCVKAPSDELRAAYRRAIHRALSQHVVPGEFALRHTGRDAGDLVIRLVSATERPMKPRPVQVPSGYERHQHAVGALLNDPHRLSVSPDARARALTLIQALADEAGRRGYTLQATTEPGATFQIVIDDDAFQFTLTEEQDFVEEVFDEDLAAAKYPWQRISPQRAPVPSGQLRLELLRGWSHRKWADRRRWRLDDKLHEALAHIEEISQDEQRKREAIRAEHEHRVALWHASIPVVREKYLADLNRQRLNEQVQAWKHAEEIRRYCTYLESCLDALNDEVRAGADRWVAWGFRYADSFDPALISDELYRADPTEIPAEELDAYMPRGMTVRHPPFPPESRT